MRPPEAVSGGTPASAQWLARSFVPKEGQEEVPDQAIMERRTVGLVLPLAGSEARCFRVETARMARQVPAVQVAGEPGVPRREVMPLAILPALAVRSEAAAVPPVPGAGGHAVMPRFRQAAAGAAVMQTTRRTGRAVQGLPGGLC